MKPIYKTCDHVCQCWKSKSLQAQFLSWTSSGNIEEWQTLVPLYLWCFCWQAHRYMSSRRGRSANHRCVVLILLYLLLSAVIAIEQLWQFVMTLNMTFVVQCAICYKSDCCPRVLTVVLDEDRLSLFLRIFLSCYMPCTELLPLGMWAVV